MNEELAHRNMAFTLYQANEMPQMTMGEPNVESMGGNVYKVQVELSNEKITPTITQLAAQNNVVRPDVLTLDGNVEVISAGVVNNKFMPGPSEMIDQEDLERIMFRNGTPGQTTRIIEYLLKGSGTVTVTYASVKGGTVESRFSLR
jgi:hypothetical protein